MPTFLRPTPVAMMLLAALIHVLTAGVATALDAPQLPPPTGSLPTGAVVLFRDSDFKGAWQVLLSGRHGVGALTIGNDQVSSLWVPPGVKVTLYEHDGQQGRSKSFTSNAGYVGDDFNDQTSSLVIENVVPPAPVVPAPPTGTSALPKLPPVPGGASPIAGIPALPKLPQVPRPTAGPVTRDQRALLVVSAGLRKFSGRDSDSAEDAAFRSLYDFLQASGAALPRAQMSPLYSEVVTLVGDTDQPGTLRNFYSTLRTLAARYAAVDFVLHCHGLPGYVVFEDGSVNVADLANAAERGATIKLGAIQRIALTSRQYLRKLEVDDLGDLRTTRGDGSWMVSTDLNGGTLTNGDRVLLQHRARYWSVTTGTRVGVRAQVRTPGDAEVFTVEVVGGGDVREESVVRLRTASGAYLGTTGSVGLIAADRTTPGRTEEFIVQLLTTDSTGVVTLPPMTPEERQHLRVLLTTACYGSSHTESWLRMGFQSAAGARAVHCDSWISFPTFLDWWGAGRTFGESVDAANRADGDRKTDAAAAPKFSNHETNSQRIARGDLGKDISSAASVAAAKPLSPARAVIRK